MSTDNRSEYERGQDVDRRTKMTEEELAREFERRGCTVPEGEYATIPKDVAEKLGEIVAATALELEPQQKLKTVEILAKMADGIAQFVAFKCREQTRKDGAGW